MRLPSPFRESAPEFVDEEGKYKNRTIAAGARECISFMLDLAEKGINEIIVVQDEALKS